jgi:hypothetical protein
MRTSGTQGAKRRSRPWRTTRPDPEARRGPDLARRDFSGDAADRLVGRRAVLPALLRRCTALVELPQRR